LEVELSDKLQFVEIQLERQAESLSNIIFVEVTGGN